MGLRSWWRENKDKTLSELFGKEKDKVIAPDWLVRDTGWLEPRTSTPTKPLSEAKKQEYMDRKRKRRGPYPAGIKMRVKIKGHPDKGNFHQFMTTDSRGHLPNTMMMPGRIPPARQMTVDDLRGLITEAQSIKSYIFDLTRTSPPTYTYKGER